MTEYRQKIEEIFKKLIYKEFPVAQERGKKFCEATQEGSNIKLHFDSKEVEGFVGPRGAFMKATVQALKAKGFDDIEVVTKPDGMPELTVNVPNTMDSVLKLSQVYRDQVIADAKYYLQSTMAEAQQSIRESLVGELGRKEGAIAFEEITSAMAAANRKR